MWVYWRPDNNSRLTKYKISDDIECPCVDCWNHKAYISRGFHPCRAPSPLDSGDESVPEWDAGEVEEDWADTDALEGFFDFKSAPRKIRTVDEDRKQTPRSPGLAAGIEIYPRSRELTTAENPVYGRRSL
jgi:hypothetical protein